MGMCGRRRTPVALPQRKRSGTHCTEGWVDLGAGLDGWEKSRPLPVFDPRTVQLVARSDTDYAVSAPMLELKYRNFKYNLLCPLLKTDGNSCRKVVTTNVPSRQCARLQWYYTFPRNRHAIRTFITNKFPRSSLLVINIILQGNSKCSCNCTIPLPQNVTTAVTVDCSWLQ
jgi:hypothetical protein